MKKSNLLSALVLALTAYAAPAFATHPNEACKIKLDLAAIAKSAGADASSVRVRFIFNGGIANLTDMNPPAPEVVSRPAQGPWIYETEIHSNLYYRTLAAVRVESLLYKPEDGTSVWSVVTQRPAGDKNEKDAAISCVQYAD